MAETSYDLDKLQAYLEDELTGPEKAEYERRLEADEGLRHLASDLKADREALRRLPDEAPPHDLLREATGRIEREMLLGEPEPAGLARVTRQAPAQQIRHAWTRRLIYSGVAASILIAVGLTYYALNEGLGLPDLDTWNREPYAARQETPAATPTEGLSLAEAAPASDGTAAGRQDTTPMAQAGDAAASEPDVPRVPGMEGEALAMAEEAPPVAARMREPAASADARAAEPASATTPLAAAADREMADASADRPPEGSAAARADPQTEAADTGPSTPSPAAATDRALARLNTPSFELATAPAAPGDAKADAVVAAPPPPEPRIVATVHVPRATPAQLEALMNAGDINAVTDGDDAPRSLMLDTELVEARAQLNALGLTIDRVEDRREPVSSDVADAVGTDTPQRPASGQAWAAGERAEATEPASPQIDWLGVLVNELPIPPATPIDARALRPPRVEVLIHEVVAPDAPSPPVAPTPEP